MIFQIFLISYLIVGAVVCAFFLQIEAVKERLAILFVILWPFVFLLVLKKLFERKDTDNKTDDYRNWDTHKSRDTKKVTALSYQEILRV